MKQSLDEILNIKYLILQWNVFVTEKKNDMRIQMNKFQTYLTFYSFFLLSQFEHFHEIKNFFSNFYITLFLQLFYDFSNKDKIS